ncbi:hypothetical protein TWF696_008019 [Orbilia brochopaga]|uniref:Uncharacterized protein n=1 Tax=Orbilia brochopaga TaxID=3140254 RepID=A0AAV9ULZ4_9PEZI
MSPRTRDQEPSSTSVPSTSNSKLRRFLSRFTTSWRSLSASSTQRASLNRETGSRSHAPNTVTSRTAIAFPQDSSEASIRNLTESRLLLLPRELRDIIYTLVAESNTTRSDIKCNGTTRHRFSALGVLGGARSKGTVWYPAAYPSYKLLSLVHTCRFLRADVLDFFERLEAFNAELSTITLEIAAVSRPRNIACGYGVPMLPTWYHLLLPPPFYAKIRRIDIELRIIGQDNDCSGFTGAVRVPLAFYSLFSILNDFIHHGPQFYYDDALLDTDLPRIEQLNVGVSLWNLSGSEYTETRHKNLDNVSRSFYSWVWLMAEVGYLFGRIGEIVVYFPGKKKRVFPVRKRWDGDTVYLEEIWEAYGFNWGPKPTRRRGSFRRRGVTAWLDELSGLVRVFDA